VLQLRAGERGHIRKRTIDPTIGKRLAAIRQHRRLSQAELAAMVGASKSAIYHYEHGNARIWPSLLSALASALRCRISDLLAPLDAPQSHVKFRPRISPRLKGAGT
jgi:transcriptional regulator with XRE-family HTH domain